MIQWTLSQKDFRDIIKFISDYYHNNKKIIEENGFRIGEPHIKTNLLNLEKHIDTIKEFNVSISGSLDLPFSLHDEYRITKLVFDNNSLTNKNRIDEVLKFTNNTANQNYIFTAYAFVVIKDSYGDVKDMCISKSQYFNLCYVGNKALDNN